MIRALFLFLFLPNLVLADDNFVILELFTSQGCSSCPPADKLLTYYHKRAEKLDLAIITLSHHVDYWNYLGWKDPFSSSEASIRQRKYAKLLSNGQSFTPQMIINGERSLVGHEQEKISKEIHRSLRNHINLLKITGLKRDSNYFLINFQIKSAEKDSLVNFFITSDVINLKVTSGENDGKKLSHTNSIIKSFVLNSPKLGENKFKFPLFEEYKKSRLIAVLQSNKTMKISGSDEISLVD